MEFTKEEAERSAFYKKLNEDVDYINATLEIIRNKMPLVSSAGRFANNQPANQEKKPDKFYSMKDYESKRNIEDPLNLMAHKSTNRNRNKNVSLQNKISSPGSLKSYSNLKDSNNVDVRSTVMEQVKNTTKSVGKYLQNLEKEVLPRFRTSKITNNIVQRDIDIPIKMAPFQSCVYENSDTYIDTNVNRKSDFVTQEEYTNVVNSPQSVRKTKNSQKVSDPRRLPKSVKYCKNNVGTIHIDAQVSEEKEKDNCELKNLTVNESYRINYKPQLCTQKLDYVQIKPDKKQNICDSTSNVGYREFSFGLELATCTRQPPLAQPRIKTSDKNIALSQIHSVLRRLMYDVSSIDSCHHHLISHLQTIMTTLCEMKTFELNLSTVLNDLVEEHSAIGFSEMFIKKKLIEIAEKMDDDQQTGEIKNHSDKRVMNRVPTIKNLIHPKNQSMKFPDLATENELKNKAMYANENSANRYPNVTSHLKSFDDTTPNYISVRNFLSFNVNNFSNSKK